MNSLPWICIKHLTFQYPEAMDVPLGSLVLIQNKRVQAVLSVPRQRPALRARLHSAEAGIWKLPPSFNGFDLPASARVPYPYVDLLLEINGTTAIKMRLSKRALSFNRHIAKLAECCAKRPLDWPVRIFVRRYQVKPFGYRHIPVVQSN